jgi:hypothetical protein
VKGWADRICGWTLFSVLLLYDSDTSTGRLNDLELRYAVLSGRIRAQKFVCYLLRYPPTAPKNGKYQHHDTWTDIEVSREREAMRHRKYNRWKNRISAGGERDLWRLIHCNTFSYTTSQAVSRRIPHFYRTLLDLQSIERRIRSRLKFCEVGGFVGEGA